MTLLDTADDVQVLPIALPVPIVQVADTATVVERVEFVEETLPEEVHHQADPVKKASLKNTALLILINPQNQNPVNRQRCLLMGLMLILTPTTSTWQE